jgi:2-C-methyl-D-erythritol 2,4-cyclodiphosphate synthase
MSSRVGLGFDVHPFADDRRLVLGGVTLDGPGLAGHSDADVIAHAVADALLGAAGLPDLGTQFAADDDRYRGVSSIGLLREVSEMVANAGWRAGNVDVVVAAEQPRLGPHLPDMVSALEDALAAVRPDVVTVKPKRAEGLGAIGRAEGIAAWAVALLISLDGS